MGDVLIAAPFARRIPAPARLSNLCRFGADAPAAAAVPAAAAAAANAVTKCRGPGAFGAEDMALGVHEHLPNFRGSALVGFEINPGPDQLMINAIFEGIDSQVGNGGKIRFNLDGMDPNAAFESESPHYNSYTSRELRYVLGKHRGSTYFYENGALAPAPR